MRRLESEALKKEFKNLIFWTYSGDVHQELYADMPTLYLWVGKEGYTQTPWFKK
jgi:hypothetical protein